MIEHMRTAFGEMDDAFHRILTGNVLATARRLAAMARAAERAGGAGLGRGDVGTRREGRALRCRSSRRACFSASVRRVFMVMSENPP